MKQGINALRGLKNKLRVMSIPILATSYIYEANMSVVLNISRQQILPKKKSVSVCYLAVHESVAMGESLVEHVSINVNAVD